MMSDLQKSTKSAADVDVDDAVNVGNNGDVIASAAGNSGAVGQATTTTTAAAGNATTGNSTRNSNVANYVEQLSTDTSKLDSIIGDGLQTTATTSSSSLSPAKTSSSTSPAKSTTTSEFPFALHFLASFHQMCVVTAMLPLVTLFTCFVTAYVFQYDEVHETHCRVYNIVPSISAITGVSPQRYFWRFSIALHIGPRIPIAFVYKNYYRGLLKELRRRSDASTAGRLDMANFMVSLLLVLNCIEVAALGGVTYISNRENYPVHERIFIAFMTCSLFYMLVTIKLHGILHSDPQRLTHAQRESIKWKKYLFVMSIVSTIGLLIFFAKHRFYCHDLAFSWFAFFEYLIAIANMLFHSTIIWDFPSQYMIIVQGSREKLEQLLDAPKALKKQD